MITFNALLVITKSDLPVRPATTSTATPFPGLPVPDEYSKEIPSDSAEKPLKTKLVVTGDEHLIPAGSLVHVVGEARKCTLTGAANDIRLAIVSSAGEVNIVGPNLGIPLPAPSFTISGQALASGRDLHGTGLVVEAGKNVAPFRVRLCLCKYTRAAQKVLRRVADDHLSITAFATFHFYEKKTIVFSPLKIDIGHADHPWLPLRPGEDPQQDMSFKALKELQASSSQQNPRAVIIEF